MGERIIIVQSATGAMASSSGFRKWAPRCPGIAPATVRLTSVKGSSPYSANLMMFPSTRLYSSANSDVNAISTRQIHDMRNSPKGRSALRTSFRVRRALASPISAFFWVSPSSTKGTTASAMRTIAASVSAIKMTILGPNGSSMKGKPP